MSSESLASEVIKNNRFWVDRADYSKTRFDERVITEELQSGQVLLQINRFAFTANNITYAAVGDQIGYWKFFPAQGEMGTIPVWGFADVVKSNCKDIAAGERFYGYYPMSTNLVVEPANVTSHSFVDNIAHRRELPSIYNQYIRCSQDPSYSVEGEELQMLLRPLFTTSFLLDDFFADNEFFAANTIVLTSASSKTALGMAFLLHQNRKDRQQDYQVVGLTSEQNLEFVRNLGCYDQVLSYDEVSLLDAKQSAASVDFAGNGALLGQLHTHFGEQLKYSCLVGASHWDQRSGSPKVLPGAQPQMFFAPSQAEKRLKDWGTVEFQQRLGQVWQLFTEFVSGWMDVESDAGPEAVERVYRNVLDGKFSPSKGYVISLSQK